MSHSMFRIEIPRRSQCCVKGKEKLEPGMVVYSALWDGEGENSYFRQDFCSRCWEGQLKEESFARIRSYWKSKIPLKKEDPLPKQRDERAFYLLKEALGRGTAEDHAEAFVLALYLARKRLLFLRQEFLQEDGLTMLLYEIASDEEMLCIRKFALSDLPIDKIQAELAKKFSFVA